MGLDQIRQLFEILFVNLILSGDNAIVIAMATVTLTGRERRLAIVLGTGASVVLRVAMTLAAGRVLTLPWVQAAGGVLLAWLALSLLFSERVNPTHRSSPRRALGAAFAITLADVTMSFDNVVALASIAAGNERLLLIGLLISVSLIMFASGLIAKVMARLQWLQWVGAAILAVTAGGMIGQDRAVAKVFGQSPWLPVAVAFGLAGMGYLASLLIRRRG
ncbi:MAG: YjbE family putative metal transport protein [Firmicutes bacterium]|nr:YjbE family putative metal transport protein [Bacillota bacterium]